jgi:hypothetical protein
MILDEIDQGILEALKEKRAFGDIQDTFKVKKAHITKIARAHGQSVFDPRPSWYLIKFMEDFNKKNGTNYIPKIKGMK